LEWRAFINCLFIQQLCDELTVQQENEATAEQLVEAADRGPYQAKADGGNLVRF
jgi:GGDEF domain-containing protein